jgi:hypothetical protein
MQIHELTQPRLDEGIASTLGKLVGGARAGASALGQKLSPVGDFKSAMADPMRQQQIKMLADKVYRGWKQYEKTLLQSNPDARETPMYEQALLAFVVKNLLGGQYLPNVINKDKITALVKQLSASSGVTEANASKVTGAANSGRPTAAEQEKFQQMAATAAAAAPKTPGTPPTPPGTPPTPPKPPKPPVAPLTPQKEKDLWLQLTQQAAVATAQAPGTGGNADNSKNSNNPSTGDARTYAQQLKPADPAVAQGLAAFGGASAKNVGNTNVKSTGNPIADALLLLAGFRGI